MLLVVVQIRTGMEVMKKWYGCVDFPQKVSPAPSLGPSKAQIYDLFSFPKMRYGKMPSSSILSSADKPSNIKDMASGKSISYSHAMFLCRFVTHRMGGGVTSSLLDL